MLVLTRKVSQVIRIGDDIEIIVLDIDEKQVRLGIKAPRHVVVNREEVWRRILEERNQSESDEAKEGSTISSEGESDQSKLNNHKKG